MISQRWRGLKDLVCDAVEHGSRAVEQLQKQGANRTFMILEALPLIEVPARAAHEIHDMALSNLHQVIRLVNQAVRETADIALDLAQARGNSATNSDAQEP